MKTLFCIITSLLVSNPVFSKCEIFQEEADFVLSDKDKTKEYISISSTTGQISKEFVKITNKYISLYNSMHRSESIHDKFEEQIKQLVDINKSNRSFDYDTWIERLRDFSNHYRWYPSSLEISLRRLAKSHHIESLYCLGIIYEQGVGVDKNSVEAWAWYDAAFAVDGIFAKEQQDRVWELLNWEEQLDAQRLSERYIFEYTDIRRKPSITLLK